MASNSDETKNTKKKAPGKIQISFPDEETPLIVMPSAHSTDRSSYENLAVLRAAAEADGALYDQNDRKATTYFSYSSEDRPLGKEDGYPSPVSEIAVRNRQKINKVLGLTFLAIVVTTLYALLKEGIFTGKTNKTPGADYLACRVPLSALDPVRDLKLADFYRGKSSQPSPVLDHYRATHKNRAIPTNAWYQNFLLLKDGEEPSELLRAYAIPFIIDAAGPVPGLRMHTSQLIASTNVLQLYVHEYHGITMGVAPGPSDTPFKASKVYSVSEMTQLAVSLSWKEYGMTAPIVKGMPYATMSYASLEMNTSSGKLSPAIVSQLIIDGTVIVDQNHVLQCSQNEEHTAWVEQEMELYVPESDFTWLVFVSEPVEIACKIEGATSTLRVVSARRLAGQVKPFYFRTTLFKPCTNGKNPVYCHQEQMHPTALHMGQGDYGLILRKHAHLFPGPKASVSYDFSEDETGANLVFNWDVQAMRPPLYPTLPNETVPELLSFALPHHLDMMTEVKSPSNDLYCAGSLVGPACMIEGSSWNLLEQMPDVGFRAERPPADWALTSILKSLETDMDYRVPEYFQRGAGDTYFSGKQLARLGRILVIAEEVEEICNNKPVCRGATLPSRQQTDDAIASLRSSVEIWINGAGETPFVYDSAWGGVVSCGCLFNGDTMSCDNTFPDCPAFENPGLNFGNAYYNDMHFHYGYHIFGAAVVSHFDPGWGRKYFEKVLLLVRNIANPSEKDERFPVMRHQDIYQGHSWASGIATNPLNGRNQESSSESLAAYESVAIYGQVMASIFETDRKRNNYNSAVEIRRVGKLMTASELRSTKKYYHVERNPEIKIYPDIYAPHVVGIMWQTMAQFQTWFGAAPFLATGIQLLPLTPIAGARDNVEWAKEMYPTFEESCYRNEVCENQGWSVLQLGALSTVGHRGLALSRARMLPTEVFETAGGNGHSMTNTLWFIATREPVEEPLPLVDDASVPQNVPNHKEYPRESNLTDCYRPEKCTGYVLDTVVDLYTCRQRIEWLIHAMGKTQKEACVQVAAVEYPDKCGKCNPLANYNETVTHANEEAARRCPPCSDKQCRSDLNRCPVFEHTYVCTAGSNEGGCSGSPWTLDDNLCSECCSLTNCPQVSPLDMTPLQVKDYEADCPACTKEQCQSSHGNLCPVNTAPYLCIGGSGLGGCSTRPWSTHGEQCNKCCKVSKNCL